ncbi:neogenin isoform X2 [Neocloeon triangulifer]|uniref:neogenin isoform X2 n=1 Tax=Neocloeon triangulifer TaxID=2078957 RepID=UPI00286F1D9D|nr:neogenin isoform X2 [Neocloeon triangulifer]
MGPEASLHLRRPTLLLSAVSVLLLLSACFCSSTSSAARTNAGVLEFSEEPQDTVVPPGSSAALHCVLKPSAAYPSSFITWRGPDGSVLNFIGDSLRRQLGNGTLFFSSVPIGMSTLLGTYQCLVHLDGVGTIASRKANLSIAFGPHVSQQPQSQTVHVGQIAHLVCGVEANPPASVVWLKNDQVLTLDDTRMMQLPSGSLDISDVEYWDAGMYRCNATSLNRHALSEKAKLTVQQDQFAHPTAPRFVAKPASAVVIEGSTVTLGCAAIGNPTPWVTWLKDGVNIDFADLDSRFLLIGTGSLQISNVQVRDAGAYQCRAENKEDSLDAMANLDVQVPPNFKKRPQDSFAEEKEDLELSCDVEGHPEPRVVWLKNGEEIKQNEYMQVLNGNNLRILGLMSLDAGIFQCVASNPAGEVQAAARLTVLRPGESAFTDVPTEPQEVMAPFTNARFITLKWKEPEHSSTPVLAYSVYYKLKDSDRERVANTSRPDISISGLTPTRTYVFRVAAINSQGVGKLSDPIEASTLAEAHVPGIPKSLKVYATSSSSIASEWQPPEGGEAPVSYYKMFYMQGDSSVEHHVVTYNTSFEVRDLKKYSEYSVWVVAFSPNHEPGASTEQVIARTLGDIPDEAPSNVTLEAASSTSIVVRWEPPPEHTQNGLINGYKIRYKRKGRNKGGETVSTAGNRRMYVITELDRDAEYQVRMWALNANGTGPPTDWLSVSTLDNDLDESKVPDAPINLRVRPAADSVHVTWTPAPGKNVMVRGYTIGWGPGIPDVFSQVVEGKQRYYHIQNLKPNSEYVISVRAYNNMGDGQPVYESVRTREEPILEVATPLLPPVGLEAVVLTAQSVVVYWTDSQLPKNQEVTDGRHYVVRYTSYHHSSNPRYKYTNTTQLNTVIVDLKPNTQYEFTVKVVKAHRESPWSMVVYNTTQEASPATAPRDLTVVSSEGSITNVNLNWQPPKTPNGQVVGYIITYTIDHNKPEKDWAMEDISGDRMTTSIKNLNPDTTYYFRIQARNKMGYGPFSNIVTFKTPYTTGGYSHGSVHNHGGPGGLGQTNIMLLGVAVGLVALLLVSSVAIFVCCRKKQEESPERNKKIVQKGKPNIKPPDLWIHHDQMELKALEQKNGQSSSSSQDPLDQDSPPSSDPPQITRTNTSSIDKRTYVPSYLSQGGGSNSSRLSDDERSSTARRSKPVSVHVDATLLHMDIQRDSASSVSSNDPRPYPRTQYTVSRAHVTLDPGTSTVASSTTISENPYSLQGGYDSVDRPHAHISGAHASNYSALAAGSGNGDTNTLGKRMQGHPLKSFSVPAPPPQAGTGIRQSSPYKNKLPAATQLPPGMSSLKRGSDAGRVSNCTTPLLTPSWGENEMPNETTRLQPSLSTEELNQEMANLEGLMKDLDAITAKEFEC